MSHNYVRDRSLKKGGGGELQNGKMVGLKLFVPFHLTTGLHGNILMYTVDS